jgi:ketosteroid isomerase-like protein
MSPARAFAKAWEAAWNAHDLEAVLALFAEGVVFTSPLAKSLAGHEDGIVRGKAALRAYWAVGLAKLPDLHFEVTSVSEGVDLLAIGFRNERGVDRLEILKFADGLVVEGHGTHPVA